MKRKRTPRPVRIPMMRELKDLFGLQAHTALASLRARPNVDAFDALAWLVNVVQLTIVDDARWRHEVRLINGAALALQQVTPKVKAGRALTDVEFAPICVGVNTIDAMIGKLDVTRLYLSLRALRTMGRPA